MADMNNASSIVTTDVDENIRDNLTTVCMSLLFILNI